MEFSIDRIDHVQVAMPRGKESVAREFYEGTLGMRETPKPEPLKGRGGVWFVAGSCQLHVGVEEPFSPAKKAHPAFVVDGYHELQQVLEEKGILYENDDSIPGVVRMYVRDPFGNRIELMQG